MRVITLLFGLLTLLGLGLTGTIPLQERGTWGNNVGSVYGVQNTATCKFGVGIRRFSILYNDKGKTKETWKAAFEDNKLDIRRNQIFVGSKTWSTYKYRVWGVIEEDESVTKETDKKQKTEALKTFNLGVKTKLTKIVKTELGIEDVSCTQAIF